MDEIKIQNAVERGVKAGFDAREEQKSAFRVDPERHFKHHNFIDSAIEFFSDSRKTFWRVVFTAGIMGILALIVLGVGTFIYLKAKGLS